MTRSLIFVIVTFVMHSSQHLKSKFLCRATPAGRRGAWGIFLFLAAFFIFSWFASTGKIDIGRLFGPCGFKQRYSLPCPTCGMTTCALVFARGRIVEAFYIQPAGALLLCLMVVSAFLALHTAVFGVYFNHIVV